MAWPPPHRLDDLRWEQVDLRENPNLTHIKTCCWPQTRLELFVTSTWGIKTPCQACACLTCPTLSSSLCSIFSLMWNLDETTARAEEGGWGGSKSNSHMQYHAVIIPKATPCNLQPLVKTTHFFTWTTLHDTSFLYVKHYVIFMGDVRPKLLLLLLQVKYYPLLCHPPWNFYCFYYIPLAIFTLKSVLEKPML